MPLKFKPTGNRVLVEPIANSNTARGGILLPEMSREAPCEGTVVALGPGKLKNGLPFEFEAKVGDRVVFNRFEGDDIVIEGKAYKLFDAKELLATVE